MKEFAIPVSDKDFVFPADTASWFRSLLNRDSNAVLEILRSHWTLSRGSLRDLTNFFLSCRPDAIVVSNEGAWLKLSKPAKINRFLWYLRATPSPETIDAELSRRSLQGREGLRDFLILFDGISNWGDLGHGFKPVREWNQPDPYYQPWLPPDAFASLEVYTAANGDRIALEPAGQLGWLSFYDRNYTREWPNFQSFLDSFIAANTRLEPFDAYSSGKRQKRIGRVR
jgi:hypothetical protein